jgi:hypothetical protein
MQVYAGSSADRWGDSHNRNTPFSSLVWVVFALAIGAVLVFRLRPQPTSSSDRLEAALNSQFGRESSHRSCHFTGWKIPSYSDGTGLYLKLIRTGENHAITLPRLFGDAGRLVPGWRHLRVGGSNNPDAEVNCGVFPSMEARYGRWLTQP